MFVVPLFYFILFYFFKIYFDLGTLSTADSMQLIINRICNHKLYISLFFKSRGGAKSLSDWHIKKFCTLPHFESERLCYLIGNGLWSFLRSRAESRPTWHQGMRWKNSASLTVKRLYQSLAPLSLLCESSGYIKWFAKSTFRLQQLSEKRETWRRALCIRLSRFALV